MQYTPPAGYRLDLEIYPVATLREKARRIGPRTERTDFHVLIYVTAGRYRHVVDFETFDCAAGSLLTLQPGQAHRFGNLVGWNGWLLIFRSDLVQPKDAGLQVDELELFGQVEGLPTHLKVAGPVQKAVTESVERMAADTELPAAPPRLNALLRSELQALLMRLHLAHAGAAQDEQIEPVVLKRFRRYRLTVEREYRRWHSVAPYAKRLGCSQKSLSLGATYPPTGFTVAQFGCEPLAVNPNFCARTTAFDPNRNDAPWTLRFERAGEAPLLVTGPSLLGTDNAVPFPVNVTISGSGVTPTISWTVPGGFAADAVRIVIYDKSVILPNGQADVIHSVAVPADNNSYAIPLTLSSGQQLQLGGNYTFNVQLIDTRGDPSIFNATNNNAEILRRSSSFFAFTPLSGSGPPNAFLPTVVNGVYNFSITDVGPNSITFIDPFVAVGYDYAIGAGDPNFASVLLPTGIGDNFFDLFLWNGTSFFDSGTDLVGGSQVFFGGLGVDRFSIRGIETSAELDPNNVTAFITGRRP